MRKKYSIRKQQLAVVQDVSNWKENNTNKSDNGSHLKKFNSSSLTFEMVTLLRFPNMLGHQG